MKTFNDYVKENDMSMGANDNEGGPSASPMSSNDGNTGEKGVDQIALADLIKIAWDKNKEETQAFFEKLGQNNSEIKGALDRVVNGTSSVPAKTSAFGNKDEVSMLTAPQI